MSEAPRSYVAHVFSNLHDSGKRPRDVVRDVGALGGHGVKFVAQFVGSFTEYTRLELPALDDAQRLIAGPLWDAGVRSHASTELKFGIMGPKRGSPPYCALVRLRAGKDPFELLDDLDAKFGPLLDTETYWYGAAVVTGDFDLLVDLGRQSLEELEDSVIGDLRSVPGIASTETSFAYLPGNAIRNE